MLTFLKALRRDERGVSALEYAILGAIILVAVVAGVTSLDIGGLFDNLQAQIDAGVSATGGGDSTGGGT